MGTKEILPGGIPLFVCEGGCMSGNRNHKYAQPDKCETSLVSARGACASVCAWLCFRVSRGEPLPGMCSHMQSDE